MAVHADGSFSAPRRLAYDADGRIKRDENGRMMFVEVGLMAWVIRNLANADAARRESADLLTRTRKAVEHENALLAEINALEAKLPKLKAALVDAGRAAAMLQRDRQACDDAIARAEALLASASP